MPVFTKQLSSWFPSPAEACHSLKPRTPRLRGPNPIVTILVDTIGIILAFCGLLARSSPRSSTLGQNWPLSLTRRDYSECPRVCPPPSTQLTGSLRRVFCEETLVTARYPEYAQYVF